MREFITIAESVQSEITEKKSKFIASLFYVENSEEHAFYCLDGGKSEI